MSIAELTPTKRALSATWGITTEALGVANSGFGRSSSNSAQERTTTHAQPQHNRLSAVEKGMEVVWLKKINKIINQKKWIRAYFN